MKENATIVVKIRLGYYKFQLWNQLGLKQLLIPQK